MARAVRVPESEAAPHRPLPPGAVLTADSETWDINSARVRIRSVAVGPAERVRFERDAAGGVTRLVRENTAGGAKRVLRIYDGGESRNPPSAYPSPDRKWLLWSEGAPRPRRDGGMPAHRIVVHATPLDGGSHRTWTVPVPADARLGELTWMPDSRAWFAWRTRYSAFRGTPSPQGGRVSYVVADYTLVEGRPGRATARDVLTVPELAMYPPILGTLPDGSTLAAESVTGKPPLAGSLSGTSPVSPSPLTVTVAVTGDRAAPGGVIASASAAEVVRRQAAGGLSVQLVTFDGLDAERVKRRFKVRVPPGASSADLYLSPDGKRLAWLVRADAVLAPPPALVRALSFGAQPHRRIREDSAAVYLVDLTPQGASEPRRVRTSGGEAVRTFWWGADSRTGYTSLGQTPSAPPPGTLTPLAAAPAQTAPARSPQQEEQFYRLTLD